MTVTHRPLCPEGRAALGDGGENPCVESARPFVLAATILASAMAFIDSSVVTIALPAIQSDLSASFGQLQWVVNGYTLMLGALILVGGGLGDRIGRRRVFVIGLVVFALGSLGCAIAPTAETLIAARVLKGVGAALLVPQSLAIISASFPKSVRGQAIGTWAAASAITTALGPPLGGFLIDLLDWRAAFWLNLPLCAIAIWLALRYVPESADPDATGSLDWTGGILAILSFGLLTVGLTGLGNAASGVPVSVWLALLAGVVGLALFVMTERRAENPIMPPGLFRSRTFSGLNLMTLLLYGALGGILFLLPFDLIVRRGLSATAVGLTLLPLGLIIGLMSRRIGALADRIGPRPFLIGGALLVASATGKLALTFDNYWVGVVLPLMLLAVGMGAVVSPLTTAVMNSVPDSKSGAASGVNNAASRLAGLLSIAGLGAIAGLVFAGLAPAETRFGVLPDPGDPLRTAAEAAFLSAYRTAMWVTAGIALLAALSAITASSDPRGEPVPDAV